MTTSPCRCPLVQLIHVIKLAVHDLDWLCMLQVDDVMRNRTCGLCGLYDGDQSNDFSSQSREVISSASTFAADYQKVELTGRESLTNCNSLAI